MRKLEKRDIILIILGVALIISVASNGVLIFNYPQKFTQRDLLTLVVGTSSQPYTLEIVDSLDEASNIALEQVVETLFTHDLRDPNLPRINLLAESYWWENSTILQIKLREDILFHDGTPFSASAAKWNLDRLQYLTNATGNNTDREIAHTQYLWMHPDGITPIINNTIVVEEYNITIMLNGAYGPFLNTLTYINSGMLSPASHENDTTRFLTLSDKPVGTGPFIYEHYIPDVEVVFSRWNNYWDRVAHFKTLQFRIFDDLTSAKNELLKGNIDYIMMVDEEDLLDYEEDSDIIVKHYTDETGIAGLDYSYLSFNNKQFNQTWRNAMVYAINYTYIIEDMLEGNVIKSNSPISSGFGDSFNDSIKTTEFNITKAREVMVSMNFGDLGWTNEQWIHIEETSPFGNLFFFYNWGNRFRADLLFALSNWFKQIGIAFVVFDPWDYGLLEFPSYEELDMYFTHWEPDYLDPFNMLDPLFNPASPSNIALVNDTNINNMMSLALKTTDDTARNRIYKDIQGYMAEEGHFHAPLYYSKVCFVHSADLRGVPYNAMGKFQAHWIWRV